MFNPKTVTVQEAVARRLVTEFREWARARQVAGPRTRQVLVCEGRFAGACEIAAITVGAPTPFAVHLDVTEAVNGHPALLPGSPSAFPTEVRDAIEAAVASLLVKWTV